MKKSLFFAAALVAMVACNKSESSISISNPEEIEFYTMAQKATRGYVVKSTFEEIVNPDTLTTNSSKNNQSAKLGHAANKTKREMFVSAFNSTDSTDYFACKTFEFKAQSTTTGYKDNWAGKAGKVYWPIGKKLEFLAYSQNNVKSLGRANADSIYYGAKKVSFNIEPEQCYQNDILYAQASGSNRGLASSKNGSDHAVGLPITFHHAQAWLTFNIKVTGSETDRQTDQKVKIDDIILKDVYNKGVLTFEYNLTPGANKPTATWDFFTQCKTDVSVDDPWDVLGNKTGSTNKYIYEESTGGTNGVQLNMLMPEQEHGDFVLVYTMNNKQNSVPLPFKDITPSGVFDETHPYSETDNTGTPISGLKSGKWFMNYHYIYNITLSINEITFAPTVTTWTEVTGFDDNPQAL